LTSLSGGTLRNADTSAMLCLPGVATSCFSAVGFGSAFGARATACSTLAA
jgi:hypothetical protein